VLRRATTLRAIRLQVEAEAAQEAAMSAPLARIQIEAMRRPRRTEPLAPTAAPARPAPTAPRPAPAEPRRGPCPGRPPRPPAVGPGRPTPSARPWPPPRATTTGPGAARPRTWSPRAILDERPDAGTLTPAELVEAMAERDVTISQSTAQALLRELRSPLSTRLANRRPARPAGAGNGGRTAARPSR
jgi:hypothetical protein